MPKLTNLTPHVVRIADQDGNIIQELPSAGVLRLASSRKKLFDIIDGIPLQKSCMALPEGMQQPGPDEYFIVSTPAAASIKNPRYIAPDTGYTAIRDRDGKIEAVRGFVTF